MVRALLLAAAVALASGCYASPPDCAIRCGTGGACPSGSSCDEQGWCRAGEAITSCAAALADASADDDAGMVADASGPDAGCSAIACDDGTTPLGVIAGDDSLSILVDGSGDTWLDIKVVETAEGDTIDLDALIELDSQPGEDFDLFVYCDVCGGSLIGQSTEPVATDGVRVFAEDMPGTLVEVRPIIEVRGEGGCGGWTLTITGHTGVNGAPSCD